MRKNADERTRTADLISSRVINHVLQWFAQPCNSLISKPLSLLWVVPYCTVLRSRWCQSGVSVRGLRVAGSFARYASRFEDGPRAMGKATS
jgi:hypothetical protein